MRSRLSLGSKEITEHGTLTEKNASILLAAVIIARSTSYLFSKICLQTIGPFTLLAERSLIAFIILAALCFKNLAALKKKEFAAGAVIGSLFYLVMASELTGLKTADSSVASLLENTAIVFVPLIQAALARKLPELRVTACCALAFLGIAFLTIEGGHITLSGGEQRIIAAAVLYAISIIVTAKLSSWGNPLTIGIVQVGTMGILALITALLSETLTLPATGEAWFALMYLAVICTCFGFTLQPMAQSKCSPEKAGLYCALNPMTAVALGVIVLDEIFRLQDTIGFILIIGGMILYARTSKK